MASSNLAIGLHSFLADTARTNVREVVDSVVPLKCSPGETLEAKHAHQLMHVLSGAEYGARE